MSRSQRLRRFTRLARFVSRSALPIMSRTPRTASRTRTAVTDRHRPYTGWPAVHGRWCQHCHHAGPVVLPQCWRLFIALERGKNAPRRHANIFERKTSSPISAVFRFLFFVFLWFTRKKRKAQSWLRKLFTILVLAVLADTYFMASQCDKKPPT